MDSGRRLSRAQRNLASRSTDSGPVQRYGTGDDRSSCSHVLAGYRTAYALEDAELAALFPLITLRLCLSAVLAAHQRAQEPDNAYLSISETPVWDVLERLVGIHPHFALARWREACGLTPCPAAGAVTAALLANQTRCGPVLDPDPRAATRVTLDLTVGSTEWDALDGDDDAASWNAAITARMVRAWAWLISMLWPTTLS